MPEADATGWQHRLLGTGEDAAAHADEFRGRTFIVNGEETDTASEKKPGGKLITKGMFPQLRDLTLEDFRAAEFHGNPD
jgi:hypothetical protein